jgi:ribosome assembly protein YihI (activator of Der GTPase)
MQMSDSIVHDLITRIDNKLDEIEVLIDQMPLLKDDKSKLIELLYDYYCDLEIAVDRYHEEWETERNQGEI